MANTMTLIFFKFALPILLGYTIFVGIAGQYAPFRRPIVAKKRPHWFLGLWVGAAIAIVVTSGLQLAYQMEIHELKVLAVPGMAIIAAALLPGIVVFYCYRWRVNNQASENVEPQSATSTDHEEPALFDNTLASNAQASHELDKTTAFDSTDIVNADEQQMNQTPITDTAASADIGMDETLRIDRDRAQYNEPLLVSAEAEVDSDTEDRVENEPDVDNVSEAESELNECEQNPHSIFSDVKSEHGSLSNVDSIELTKEAAELAASRHEINRLRDELDAEIHARKELEIHLRITRKGLGVLESESRDFEANKTTALINIERELEDKIKRTSAAEARADREMSKRIDLENEMLTLREDALKATTDCRVSTEARANALSTANKATTLARQAMQIRSRLESQLGEVKGELDRKQATISSLIKALEKEKSRTQEDVSLMAKQLRLHEKQMQARRTLEEVTRTVDNRLTTRLVKKVAKSRN